MEPIRIRAKLSAYTKGGIPTKLSQLENDIDAPKDGNIYARQDGHWVSLGNSDFGDDISLPENSGLNLTKEGNKAQLSIRQKVLIDSEIPSDYVYEDDTTYYILETTPNLYINGGTAFSDKHEDYILKEEIQSEYKENIFGGKNTGNTFSINLQPLNSKGVLYNG